MEQQYIFNKGDVVQCINGSFIEAQKLLTPNYPRHNRLYTIRAVLKIPSKPGMFTVVLEEVRNVVRTVYIKGEKYYIESGFDPSRFKLMIAAEETNGIIEEFYDVLRDKTA